MNSELFSLEWLIQDRVTLVQYSADGDLWQLHFASGSWLNSECMWRLIKDGVLSSTSFDHAHRFGLAQPFDGVEALKGLVALPVTAVGVRSGTADLTLQFGTHLALEFLAISGGYEAWSIAHPRLGSVFACAGGQLHGVAAQQQVQGPTSPPSAGPRP